MTALRQRYIRDLAIRGKAKRTQEAYTSFVADLARHYHRSPDLLSYDEVADWLFHLIRERKLASSSVNIAVNAVRFLYGVTLSRDLHELFAKVPRIKRETRRAHAYSVKEVEAILHAPRRLRDRAFLMTVYSAGLRLMEACSLRTREGIDRARMQLRITGKGAKERLVPLNAQLLEVLEATLAVLLALQAALTATSKSRPCPHCRAGEMQLVSVTQWTHPKRCRPP